MEMDELIIFVVAITVTFWVMLLVAAVAVLARMLFAKRGKRRK